MKEREPQPQKIGIKCIDCNYEYSMYLGATYKEFQLRGKYAFLDSLAKAHETFTKGHKCYLFEDYYPNK